MNLLNQNKNTNNLFESHQNQNQNHTKNVTNLYSHPKINEKPSLIPLLILTLIACALSTLSVQIYQLHYGPYVRTIQCYFNYKFLEHNSWDIYEAVQVVYWRTDQYITYPDMNLFFVRISDTIQKLQLQSFLQIDKQKLQSIGKIEMQAQYFDLEQQSTILFYKESIVLINSLFEKTVFMRQFYQNLRNIKIHILIPIQQYQHHTGIQIKVKVKFDDGLLMSVQVQADPVRIQSQHIVFSQQSQSQVKNLQIRKLQSYKKMQLQVIYLKWINIGLNGFIFFLQFWFYKKDYNKLKTKLTKKKVNEIKNQVNFQNQRLLKKRIYNQNQYQQKYQQKQQAQQYIFIKIIKNLGVPRLLGLLVSFFTFLSYFYGQSQGLLCLFCWLRVVTYLSYTNNPFMIGILFKRAIPIYIKILSNLVIILTAFVLLSMVIYQLSIKFQNIQLGYYQYLFNYFQYGIYENFIALAPYGFIGQFFYFIQCFFLINMGNNILQSILAGQVLKNTNQRNLIEMLSELQCQCPRCYSAPKVKNTLQVNLKQKSRFFSKIVQDNFLKSKASELYQIKIISPKLSPYFHHQKRQQSKSTKSKKKPIRQSEQSSPFSIRKFNSDFESNFHFEGQNYETKKKKILFEIGDQNQFIPRNQFSNKIQSSRQAIEQILLQLKLKRQNLRMTKSKLDHTQKMQLFIVLKPILRKIESIQKTISIK